MIDQLIKQKVLEELLPELENLADNLPQYGEISLRAKIYDYKVGTVTLGTEISKKIKKTTEGD